MIPPELYSFIYVHLMLVLILITLMSYAQGGVKGFNQTGHILVPVFLVIYLGTRPIAPVFVDMMTYAQSFEIAAKGGPVYYTEPLFKSLMEGLSLVTSVEVFFLVCAFIYVIPIAAGLKYKHGNFAYGALLATITSFSFFTYGVNGIRNGMATSILLAAIAAGNRKFIFAIIALAAISMHTSVAVPALFYALTYLNANVMLYTFLWVSALTFTVITSGATAAFLSTILSSSEDNRVGYLVKQGDDKGGFRLDFLLYGIVPVIISYHWANPKIKKDPFYRRMLCTYLATNAFWILAMYAAFSNRFAYLSWFIMPWLIVYPFIPNDDQATGGGVQKFESNKFAAMIVGQFALTYLFTVIIYPNR